MLSRQITVARRRVALGERPVFHVTTEYDGLAVDVRIRELPTIHVYVPDSHGVAEGARGLIAKTLGIDPATFIVASDD